jgi:hypothetical protein
MMALRRISTKWGVLVLAALAMLAGGFVGLLAIPRGAVAQVVLPPNPASYPVTEPITPCANPAIIYGVHDNTMAGFQGIYEIDTAAKTVTKIKSVLPNGMWNAAVASATQLYVTDNVGWALQVFDIPTQNLIPTGEQVPPTTHALGEGNFSDLWAGTGNGGLDLRPPTGFRHVGDGARAYTGDLIFTSPPATVPTDTNECLLFGAVNDDPGSAYARVSRFNGQQDLIGHMGASVIGLAFDGYGNLWASSGGSIHPVDPKTGALGGAILTAPFIIWDLASYPCRSDCPASSDLGDAPDSTNHFSTTMTAYAGQLAGYPTVYESIPVGSMHQMSDENVWFGVDVSEEEEADLPPDEDPTVNIIPLQDLPNLDHDDDGGVFPLTLGHCAQSQIQYKLSFRHNETEDYYVNVWFDFNRDGDWDDAISCVDPQRGTVTVYEWAVQNQVSPHPGAGMHMMSSPFFEAYDPAYPDEDMWMRLVVSDQPAADPDGAGPLLPDGRGPYGGYEVGETEDYYLVPVGANYEYVAD